MNTNHKKGKCSDSNVDDDIKVVIIVRAFAGLNGLPLNKRSA